MSRRRLDIPLVALVALGSSLAASAPPFRPDAYLRHVRYLASDELEGRGNGTPQLDLAADYIADRFRAAGLEPAGDAGTYFQKLTVTTGSRVGPGNRLTLEVGGAAEPARLGRDFFPVGIGDALRIEGEVVFAGYGISAEDERYDDYKGLDVTDKVVLVLAHEPRENDDGPAFDGRQPTLHGHDNTKALNARYRNARAVLIAPDPAGHDEAAAAPRAAAAEAQVDELGICALRITRELADRLLASGHTTLRGIQKQIDADLAPRSFALGSATRVRIELDVTRVRKEVRNVAARVPGRDPARAAETIVIGAHYDHLGRGGRSSMAPQSIGLVHNGADDNASGTAGLLELAAALVAGPEPPARSYLFLAFAGEELGLNGSAHWTKHPTVPLESVVAMLNMDMIGRVRNRTLTVGGAGTSPEFRSLLARAAGDAGLTARLTDGGYGASDHTSFYVRNIPVLFFFSGLHADYHRPSDDWEKIDAEGATRVLALVRDVALGLNGLPARPRFTKVAEPPGSRALAGGSGYGAYFGSIPDMGDEVKGVRFADVRPGSPAAKAGLRGGDVLVEFAGREIRSLEDFTYMLRTHKPGDLVPVKVLRDGGTVTAQVRLEVRR